MKHDLTAQLNQTPEQVKLYQRERAKFEVAELVCEVMDRVGVSRSELAERLGTTKGYISQLLNGERNMTVGTLSDLFWALGRSLHFWDAKLSASDPAQTMSWLSRGRVEGPQVAWELQPKWNLRVVSVEDKTTAA